MEANKIGGYFMITQDTHVAFNPILFSGSLALDTFIYWGKYWGDGTAKNGCPAKNENAKERMMFKHPHFNVFDIIIFLYRV